MTHPELPAAVEEEKAVLGSILLNREAVLAVASWLTPAMFYQERHAQIYAAMLHCFERRVPPDIRTVAAELERRNQLDDCGGARYLLDLTDVVPTSYHIEHYARFVEETARLRALIAAGAQIAALGYDRAQGAEAAEAQAHTLLTEATSGGRGDDLISIGDIADAVWTQATGEHESGVPTGFPDLDEVLGGLRRQDLIIVAARPSVGKTAFSLSLVYEVASNGRPAVVFSLEMSRVQLVERLAAMHCGVDLHRLRTRRLSERDLTRLAETIGAISEWPIVVCDLAGLSPLGLRARVMRQLARWPDSLVVVDYLQLMEGPRTENRVQEVSAISRDLKRLARDANVPIVALSQLSRAVEGRISKVPMLSDLRETGAIEQDSDIVIFLYREELYDKETDKKGIAELHIAKHRNGPLGVIPLRFDSTTTRFQTLSYRTPEGY